VFPLSRGDLLSNESAVKEETAAAAAVDFFSFVAFCTFFSVKEAAAAAAADEGFFVPEVPRPSSRGFVGFGLLPASSSRGDPSPRTSDFFNTTQGDNRRGDNRRAAGR